ncbi:uncharacterized protein KD926_008911 [Aspergillus affinis]|uniref:uncharacterized protein n=1 Tax=Aspergillus affinis TaxID=1070780 RepID=UPI0022FE799E|nr:uncharacterized protein KD926_008911 [Aspergillus affinis]KAI9039925.1 hypothetical protein KD926_008911 [Aspergillus affinis]
MNPHASASDLPDTGSHSGVTVGDMIDLEIDIAKLVDKYAMDRINEIATVMERQFLRGQKVIDQSGTGPKLGERSQEPNDDELAASVPAGLDYQEIDEGMIDDLTKGTETDNGEKAAEILRSCNVPTLDDDISFFLRADPKRLRITKEMAERYRYWTSLRNPTTETCILQTHYLAHSSIS